MASNIIHHDVPQDLIDRTFAEARRFHELPLSAKMALRMNEHNNGYMAMGKYAVWTSDVNANDKPDLNEAFFVKREADLMIRWPGQGDVLSDRTSGQISCPVFVTLSWRTRMQSMPSVVA